MFYLFFYFSNPELLLFEKQYFVNSMNMKTVNIFDQIWSKITEFRWLFAEFRWLFAEKWMMHILRKPALKKLLKVSETFLHFWSMWAAS